MTRNQKIFLACAGSFIILYLIFEVTAFSINYNASRTNIQSSVSWNATTFRINSLKDKAVGYNSCPPATSLKDVSLVVKYEHDSIRGPLKKNCMDEVVSVVQIHHGIMWTPFLKHFSFECDIPIKIDREIFKFSGDSAQVVAYRIEGDMKVTGTITIYGICSVNEARRIMVKGVLENVYHSVRKKMDTAS